MITLNLTDFELKTLFSHVAGTYEKSGIDEDVKREKQLYKKIKTLYNSSTSDGSSRYKIEVFSNTYLNEDIKFLICAEGFPEGESERFVYPLLGESWQIISEDTYKKNQSFSHENFQSAIVELKKLGFEYKGPIDSDAIS